MKLPSRRSGSNRLASRGSLQGTGLIRVLVGGALVAQPERSLRAMGLAAPTDTQAAHIARMVGTRDALLGAGLIHAARRGSDPMPWLLTSLVADLSDLVVFVDARRRSVIGTKPAVLSALAAASGVAAEAAAVRAVRRA